MRIWLTMLLAMALLVWPMADAGNRVHSWLVMAGMEVWGGGGGIVERFRWDGSRVWVEVMRLAAGD